MSGYSSAIDNNNPHLGGSVVEGDPDCFCPAVWDYVLSRFAIKSVMDLGCGSAISSYHFYSRGVPVVAVEGLRQSVMNSVYPSILHDITKGPVVTKVDLVHCHEVVEHIEEQHLENLLQSLTCGKYILMTNATPGQGGHHHVNEQPTEYWIKHLARYNCEVLSTDTNRIRILANQEGAKYMAQTGLLLVNKNFNPF